MLNGEKVAVEELGDETLDDKSVDGDQFDDEKLRDDSFVNPRFDLFLDLPFVMFAKRPEQLVMLDLI
jgi:hypothetical protein